MTKTTLLSPRRKEAHKGDFGRLLIVGGSPGLTGAVCLAGAAAMRGGCGLVTIGIPASLNDIIEAKTTEVMSLPLPETAARTFSRQALAPALDFLQTRSDGAVIGPGISLHAATSGFVRDFIARSDKPLVIDADALKLIARDLSVLKKARGPLVLTPHPGEMSILAGRPVSAIQSDRSGIAGRFARDHGVIVVLKGHNTVVTDGRDTYVNLTGNPGMATAGSGDVLSGLLGTFLVQRPDDPFLAASDAVFVHGLAGDLAAREKTEVSLIASDIIEFLPDAFKTLNQGRVG